MGEQANRTDPWQINFTREQLAIMSEHSTNPLVADLAKWAKRQLDKIEGLELDAEDAREDIDALTLENATLLTRLATAEAERDILQWASDHAGGGGECSCSAVDYGSGIDDGIAANMRKLRREELGHRTALTIAEVRELAELRALDALDQQKEDFFAGDSVEPERPHESLVWAMFYASMECDDIEEADGMLEVWRARWPEPKA